ncbi:uncharacterized protein METZ01_LOCUS233707 [marine metagenome]|uniref:Uncharacterized protein n=1 Tax=marine metagenome TaxID=408172 RepID=A0A382H231_9ZZZZ
MKIQKRANKCWYYLLIFFVSLGDTKKDTKTSE